MKIQDWFQHPKCIINETVKKQIQPFNLKIAPSSFSRSLHYAWSWMRMYEQLARGGYFTSITILMKRVSSLSNACMIRFDRFTAISVGVWKNTNTTLSQNQGSRLSTSTIEHLSHLWWSCDLLRIVSDGAVIKWWDDSTRITSWQERIARFTRYLCHCWLTMLEQSAHEAVVIRYENPREPGMPEMVGSAPTGKVWIITKISWTVCCRWCGNWHGCSWSWWIAVTLLQKAARKPIITERGWWYSDSWWYWPPKSIRFGHLWSWSVLFAGHIICRMSW